MSSVTATSFAREPEACAAELRAALGDLDPAFVIFFATPDLDPVRLGTALRGRFGNVSSLGCTTAGELGSGRMLHRSVVMAALSRDCLRRAKVREIPDVRSQDSIGNALEDLGRDLDLDLSRANPERYVGLVLHDGLNAAEERVMSEIGQRTNVPFVGGSAGDELRFEKTTMFCNFEPTHDRSVIALLEPAHPYTILKTQSFAVLDKMLTATGVNESTRTVTHFNGRPALREYASALGVDVAEAPRYFRRHPVGIVLPDGEPFVRGIRCAEGDDMKFFCEILPGTEVHLLEARDMVERTGADLARAVARLGKVSALVNFDCVERRAELERCGAGAAYGQLFTSLPAVGFSTYGESYIGHINQTATMLLLG
jgi:hypothetical protein